MRVRRRVQSRPLQITAFPLGRSLNPDHFVAEFTAVFAPQDTVAFRPDHGRRIGKISVGWTYGGKVVSEPKKRLANQDVAATEFTFRAREDLPLGNTAPKSFSTESPSAPERSGFRVQASG